MGPGCSLMDAFRSWSSQKITGIILLHLLPRKWKIHVSVVELSALSHTRISFYFQVTISFHPYFHKSSSNSTKGAQH